MAENAQTPAFVPLLGTDTGPAAASEFSMIFVLLVTLIGFLVPMLLVYPPVAPRPSDFLNETHSRLGVEEEEAVARAAKGGSKVCKEAGKEADKAADERGGGSIAGIWIYPIKSCRGIRLSRSRVLPTGLEFDRLFSFAQLKTPFPARAGVELGGDEKKLVEVKKKNDNNKDEDDDEPVWDIITQRQFPRLATLQVELWRPDQAKAKRVQEHMRADDRAERAATLGDTFVVVRYPWGGADGGSGLAGLWARVSAKLARGWRAVPEVEVVLPVTEDLRGERREKGEYGRVRVWRDTVQALDLSAELPESLQLYLGVSNRLGVFRIDPAGLRQVFRCAPASDEAGYQPVTAFQDGYPVHLLNRSSVLALESVMDTDKDLTELDERRFRANIILSGVPAYDEDSWKMILFRSTLPGADVDPAARFHVSCRTVRCKLPNVDQDTGDRHPREPDHALRTFRDIDDGAPKMGCLGMQMTPMFDQPGRPELMEHTVDVGMTVDVLERGEHHYLKS